MMMNKDNTINCTG